MLLSRLNRILRVTRIGLPVAAALLLLSVALSGPSAVRTLTAPTVPTLKPVANTSQTFTNPVGGQGQDPDITMVDGYYYYTQSNGDAANTLSIRRSPSLATLATAPKVTIWSASQSGSPCCELWAPELHRINGTWYVYYSADTGNNDSHRVYVLSASNPFGPYTFVGQLSDSTNQWEIDGTVVQVPGGQLYYLWAGSPLGIYIAAMDSPTHISSARTQISTPTYDWEKSGAAVNEGPEAIVHGNTIDVTYSASMCWTPDYKLGLVHASLSSNLLTASSWTKSATPVFQRNDGAGVYGPGHNGFFTSPDGSQSWLVYHAVTNSAGNCQDQRTVRAQQFTWNSDGTPNLGSPVGLSTALTLPAGDPGSAGPILTPNNKCVDVATNTNTNGNAVEIWDCNGVPGQQWTLQPNGQITAFGKCLDVVANASTNGSKLELWDCNTAGGQIWQWQSNGSLRNPQSGRCLDDPSGNTANGTVLQIYDCNGAGAQQWAVPGVNGSVTANGGKCVDANGGSTANGTAVQLYDCVGGDAQNWTPAFDGTLRNSGKCLDINGNSTTAGALVQLYDCNGAGGQVWSRQANGSLKNPQSGLCLDDPNGNTANNTRLRIWACNGAAAQVFHVNG